VNDRGIRASVRGLVAATVACAIVAEIAARLVLRHGSGTYFALLVFLPLLVAPGAFVWRAPRPRYLLLWSIGGWVASLAWAIGGTPYSYERELANWVYVATPTWIAIGLVGFAAPVVALFAMPGREPPPELELLAARLRRIVMIVFMLALVIVVACFIVDIRAALSLALFTFLLIAPGIYVYRNPRPVAGWLWAGVSAPFAAVGVTLWLISFDANRVRIVEAGLGTISVLILIAVPLILMGTPRYRVTDSSARANYRSRNR
jgi:hypothetical protein